MQWTCTGTSLKPLHDRAELIEVLVGRVLKIDRDVDINHAEPADARGLVREGLLVGVEPEIHDMPDAERLDVRELRLGRLAGCGDPVVEPSPMIDHFRVSHWPLAPLEYRGRHANGEPPRWKAIIVQSRWMPKCASGMVPGLTQPFTKSQNNRNRTWMRGSSPRITASRTGGEGWLRSWDWAAPIGRSCCAGTRTGPA